MQGELVSMRWLEPEAPRDPPALRARCTQNAPGPPTTRASVAAPGPGPLSATQSSEWMESSTPRWSL